MYEQISRNPRRTVLIVAIAVIFLAGVGYFLGYLLTDIGIAGPIIALVIAAVMSYSSYRYGDRLVLRAARARKVSPQEEPRLHNIV